MYQVYTSRRAHDISLFSDPDVQYVWPPKDPNVYKDRDISTATALETRLQGSPWTYGNDGPNPALRARGTSNYPPYHAGYQTSPQHTSNADRQFDHEYDGASTTSSPSRVSSDYDANLSFGRNVRMRRGSEGWEVRPLSNEEIVQQYAWSRGLESANGPAMMSREPSDQEGCAEGDEDDPSGGIGLKDGAPESDSARRYNTYVPEASDSSEDEALAVHVGTYTDE